MQEAHSTENPDSQRIRAACPPFKRRPAFRATLLARPQVVAAGTAGTDRRSLARSQPDPEPVRRQKSECHCAAPVSDPQLRALYEAYIAAKKRCNEDVSRLTYEAVAKTVTKQVPELIAKFKAKTVEFKVEVKDGKAILKAIPKV